MASASFAVAATLKTTPRPGSQTDPARSSGKQPIACTFRRYWRMMGTCLAFSMREWPPVGRATRARNGGRSGSAASSAPRPCWSATRSTLRTRTAKRLSIEPAPASSRSRRKQAGRPGFGECGDLRQPHLHARGRASRRTAARDAVLPRQAKVTPGPRRGTGLRDSNRPARGLPRTSTWQGPAMPSLNQSKPRLA